MTPGGPCFGCREFTSRFDKDRDRWACRKCHPANLPIEDAFAAIMNLPELDQATRVRLPGETRQEWRRRLRGG